MSSKKFCKIDQIRMNEMPSEESDLIMKLFQYNVKEDLYEKQKFSDICFFFP